MATRADSWYASHMAAITARLDHGRFILDEAGADPRDTHPLHLVIEEEGDELDDEEREHLEVALAASRAESARGETFAMEDVMAELRALRGA